MRVEVEERFEGQVRELLLDPRRIGPGEERIEAARVACNVEADDR